LRGKCSWRNTVHREEVEEKKEKEQRDEEKMEKSRRLSERFCVFSVHIPTGFQFAFE